MGSAVLRLSVAAILALGVRVEASSLEGVHLRLAHHSDTPGRLYLGEPLVIVATTVNEGRESPTGGFRPWMAELYVRPSSGEPFRVNGPSERPSRGGLRVTICTSTPVETLTPGQSVSAALQFLLDPRTNKPWLAHEGRYEVFAVLRPLADRYVEVRSEPLSIVLSRVPRASRSAYHAYRASRLMEFVSNPMDHIDTAPRWAETADSYLARFPKAPFARHVRAALRQALVHQGASPSYSSLTPRQREILVRMNAEDREREDEVLGLWTSTFVGRRYRGFVDEYWSPYPFGLAVAYWSGAIWSP